VPVTPPVDGGDATVITEAVETGGAVDADEAAIDMF